jgi:hypothetical protein
MEAKTPAPGNPRKWIATVGVMLALTCAYVVMAYGPVTPAPKPALPAARSAGLICRGTIVSIEIDDTALRDKLRRHDSLWIVTVRTDDDPSGNAPGRDMRFTMHSPSMCGFRKVGEHVEVDDGGMGLRATPCPPGT